MLRWDVSAANNVGKPTYFSLLTTYSLDNLVVLVRCVLLRFSNVTKVNQSPQRKNKGTIWIQKHQRISLEIS